MKHNDDKEYQYYLIKPLERCSKCESFLYTNGYEKICNNVLCNNVKRVDGGISMYCSLEGGYKCSCNDDLKLKTAAEALRHLCHHELKGDIVPERAFNNIGQQIVAEVRREEKRKWGKIAHDNTATNRGINHDTLGS